MATENKTSAPAASGIIPVNPAPAAPAPAEPTPAAPAAPSPTKDADVFLKDVVIPLARDARAWAAVQHASALDEAAALVKASKLSLEAFLIVAKRLGNVSATRQAFEAAKIIPKSDRVRGKSWLAALAAE